MNTQDSLLSLFSITNDEIEKVIPSEFNDHISKKISNINDLLYYILNILSLQNMDIVENYAIKVFEILIVLSLM
jgi:hypothetical protein